jgi:hypothetical protein
LKFECLTGPKGLPSKLRVNRCLVANRATRAPELQVLIYACVGGNLKRRDAAAAVCFFALLLGACGGPGASKPGSETQTPAAAAQPAAPAVPPEIQKVGEGALGSEAEVLVYGDLALNGKQQVLVINRLKKTPDTKVPGTIATRAVIVENDGDTWKQVFLCDEHLKNSKGFLASTPIAPVTAWRLQYEQTPDAGLVMYFTPLDKPAGGYVQTIGIKWNKKYGRYQSLDRTYENFLGETQNLEIPQVTPR